MGLYKDFRDFLKERVSETLWIHRKRLSLDLYGQCYEIGNGWQIDIRNDLSEDSQVETLMHEYAHILGRTPYHGRKFGISYSEVYKIWLAFVRMKDECRDTKSTSK